MGLIRSEMKGTCIYKVIDMCASRGRNSPDYASIIASTPVYAKAILTDLIVDVLNRSNE